MIKRPGFRSDADHPAAERVHDFLRDGGGLRVAIEREAGSLHLPFRGSERSCPWSAATRLPAVPRRPQARRRRKHLRSERPPTRFQPPRGGDLLAHLGTDHAVVMSERRHPLIGRPRPFPLPARPCTDEIERGCSAPPGPTCPRRRRSGTAAHAAAGPPVPTTPGPMIAILGCQFRSFSTRRHEHGCHLDCPENPAIEAPAGRSSYSGPRKAVLRVLLRPRRRGMERGRLRGGKSG